MKFIGIDPGVSGAIAVINGTVTELFSWETADIPTIKVWKRNEVDPEGLLELLSLHTHCPDLMIDFGAQVSLERVHSMPGQGVASTFSFGKATGTIIGCLAGVGLWERTTLVTPQVWKKAMLKDMPKEKESSIVRCRELFPYSDHFLANRTGVAFEEDLPKRSHENRADALLIAEHLRLTTGEVSE